MATSSSPQQPAQLTSLVRRCLLPVELDDPSLDFLCSQVGEEADFLREVPGCLTRAQLVHLLVEKLEATLVSFEIAKDQPQAVTLCRTMVQQMERAEYIQLASGSDDEEEGGTTANTAAGSSADAYTPPLLSAPVRVSDITRADEEKASELEFNMAAIQKAQARSKWTPEEERTFFQSIADTPVHEPPSPEEEEREEMVEGGCAMCQRVMPLTRHHLIPVMHHKHGKWASMDQAWLKSNVALICRPCHSAVHSMEDERTLAEQFHTLELLMADERMQRWVKYIAKRRVNRTVEQTKNGSGKLHYGK